MTPPDFDGLAAELEEACSAGAQAPWPEGLFARRALDCFAVQFAENAVYRALCESRGVSPATVTRWQDVPMVPATAFKHLDLVTGALEQSTGRSPENPAGQSSENPTGRPEAVYVTSGTTRGGTRRGRHLVRRLSLYRASALGNFREHLFPDGVRLPLLSLIPSPDEAPESSLSAMMGMVASELSEGVRWAVDSTGTLDLRSVKSAASEGPCLIAGTAFAFVHLLDALEESGPLAFADGTRVMETGGFKGRAVAVSRDELYQRLSQRLGVPAWCIVNEYGMTELLSQLYEPVLRTESADDRRHVAPPWLRVRALDPVTLHEVPAGSDGLLAFFDLANLGSVCHVLTEDVGAVTDDGVLLRGRAVGSEPRGCSRAMDELMAAAGRSG